MQDTTAAVCDYCGIPFHHGCSFSQLECGHRYHLMCLHHKVAHVFSFCPLCAPQIPADGKFQPLLPLNFGDDHTINNYQEKFTVINTMYGKNNRMNSKNELMIGTPMMDMEYVTVNPVNQRMSILPQHSLVTPIMTPKSTGIGKAFDSIFSMITEIGQRETRYGSDIERDPCTLLGNRTSSNEMVFKKGIDFSSLLRANISMAYFLLNGYMLIDMIILGANQSDILAMGFDAKLWRDYKKVLPYMETMETFSLTFNEIFFYICQKSIEKFAWMDFTLEELEKMRVNVYMMIGVGFNKRHFSLFPQLFPKDWRQLGLNFQIMKKDLGITQSDVQHLLQWSINPSRDTIFKQSFEQIFGGSFDDLNPDKINQ